MTRVSDLHRKWMKNKEYPKAQGQLAPEFALSRTVIEARVTAGLTQEQLAERMETTQSVIARLESGRARPSTQTLERLAMAQCHLVFPETECSASKWGRMASHKR